VVHVFMEVNENGFAEYGGHKAAAIVDVHCAATLFSAPNEEALRSLLEASFENLSLERVVSLKTLKTEVAA